MTPATRALDAAGVGYTTHVFEHDPAVRDYGREAADAIGADHDQVFKTLVVVADGALAVAILPVSCQLSMKLAARRARCQARRDVRHDARRAHHRLRRRRHQPVRSAQAPADGHRRERRALRHDLRQRWPPRARPRRRPRRPRRRAGGDRRRRSPRDAVDVSADAEPGAIEHRRYAAGWRSMASMRATRVRAGGWVAAIR